MIMDFTNLGKFYQKLKKPIIFNVFAVIIIVFNIVVLGFKMNDDFVNNILTIVSIVYGFLISAICNMFGRKVTEKMNMVSSKSNPAVTQLQELKSDYTAVSLASLFLLVLSLLYYIFKGSSITLKLNSELFVLLISGVYLSFVVFLFIGIYYLTIMLLNFMVNEPNIK